MPISDIPIFSLLRTRMHWHQERQRLLSENVANADTPNFRPRDLAPPDVRQPGPTQVAGLTLARTDPAHVGGAAALSGRFNADTGGVQFRPGGNAVNLEEEMLRVASNQQDYLAATALYSRSLGLIKTAMGKK